MPYVPAASGTYAIHPSFPESDFWVPVIAFRIEEDEVAPVLYPPDEGFDEHSALLFPDDRVLWKGQFYENREAWLDAVSTPKWRA